MIAPLVIMGLFIVGLVRSDPPLPEPQEIIEAPKVEMKISKPSVSSELNRRRYKMGEIDWKRMGK